MLLAVAGRFRARGAFPGRGAELAAAAFVTDPPRGDVDYTAFRARRGGGGTDAGLRRFEAECLHTAVERGCLARAR